MKSLHTRILFTLVAAWFLSGCQRAPDAKPNTLTAIRVSQVTSDPDSDLWKQAPLLVEDTQRADLQDSPSGPPISFQAIYDHEKLALRVQWADPTENNLKNAWFWDGKVFSRGEDEDRLMIHFPIGNDPEFASKGCAAVCHNQSDDPEKWYMATDSAEIRMDQWHWKSTRTNPSGQADDKWLGIRANPADTESAHYGDELIGGGEIPNENERGNKPMYVNGVDSSSPFIFQGQETLLDEAALQPGTVIPGYVLAPMQGSRGDLSANGTWQEGMWVVVIVRALDTGNDDDVAFIPPKPIPFGVAVIDNGNGYKHVTIVEGVLTLEWWR